MSIPVLMNSQYIIEMPDISYFQNYTKQNVRVGINFKKVASRKSIRAVLVKAAEGDVYLLSDFLEQAEGFYAEGLPIIPYLFYHYEITPAYQINVLKKNIAALSFKPKRIMVDIEDDDNEVSRSPKVALQTSEYPVWTKKALKVAAHVRDTMDAAAQITGIPPLWYGADWWQGWWAWMAGSFGGMDMSWMNIYDFHCASYTAPWMYIPYGINQSQIKLWQWISTPPLARQIEGFPNPGSLDMNWWLGTNAECDTWLSATGTVDTELARLRERNRALEAQQALWLSWLNTAPK